MQSGDFVQFIYISKMIRGGSRTAVTSKMEHFVIIVNGWKPLTIITKSSILDVAAVLDPSLYCSHYANKRKTLRNRKHALDKNILDKKTLTQFECFSL